VLVHWQTKPFIFFLYQGIMMLMFRYVQNGNILGYNGGGGGDPFAGLAGKLLQSAWSLAQISHSSGYAVRYPTS
jgi:hypothetical protein